MPLVPLDTLDDPRVADYHIVRDGDLLRARNLFVAEGRLVVQRLVESRRYQLRSMLVSETACEALRATWSSVDPAVPIYVGRSSDFRTLAGLNIHRGCLALAERPAPRTFETIASGARTVVVLDGVGNPDNVGGIFRNAAAFAVDAVLLDRKSGDPLYRKAIRTSMAATLTVPFARMGGWAALGRALHEHGFTVAAFAPDGEHTLASFAATPGVRRLALVFGAEGDGLSADARTIADMRVRIPIRHGMDSLNVAVASGIALAALDRVG